MIEAGLLEELEATALEAVRSAGELTRRAFGKSHKITQKNPRIGADIVTETDADAQKLIFSIISNRFPDHSLLGEEGLMEVSTLSDFLWVIDPIDGTKNFAAGAIEFGISVGVLYRGVPAAGAIWTLWSNDKGRIVHARKGGGSWLDGKRLKIVDQANGIPVRDRHAIVPGNYRWLYKRQKPLRRDGGDMRVIGSVSWEAISLVTNIAQYIATGVCYTWDFAAALVIITEAGGLTLTNSEQGSLVPLTGWETEHYSNQRSTYNAIREWRGVLVAAPPLIGEFLKSNLSINRSKNLRKLRN